jgi:hypothetical protein
VPGGGEALGQFTVAVSTRLQGATLAAVGQGAAIKPRTAQQTQFITLATRAAVSVQLWTR